jgi:hypothetical protein
MQLRWFRLEEFGAGSKECCLVFVKVTNANCQSVVKFVMQCGVRSGSLLVCSYL